METLMEYGIEWIEEKLRNDTNVWIVDINSICVCKTDYGNGSTEA